MDHSRQAIAHGWHVAIIMDGNGRWAASRGLPRPAGHHAGVRSLRKVVESAAGLDIATLTLYAFSSDNWKRPESEVRALMYLITTQLPLEAERCAKEGIRMSVIGRRDRMPPEVMSAIDAAEALTARGSALHVRLALDYSSRDALATAAGLVNNGSCRTTFSQALARACHAESPVPDVDLLIRTGGEQRLSDFLLWECAYAELYFTPCRWPDFNGEKLEKALRSFRKRQRRFGRVACA